VEIFGAGFIAGLALAIPLGPMAILLIGTTLRSGRGVGSFGALAMASVDACYAAIVFAFGNLVIAALSQWVFPLRILGSVILVIIAIKIWVDSRKTLELGNSTSSPGAQTKVLTYAKFFGLTIINPATAFYFVGITPSVSALNSSQGLAIGFLVFAGGVFFGSLIWQLTLVQMGSLTAKLTDKKVQNQVQRLGAILILVLAVGLLLI
jgi:threonine/homoserine/homoserine lactone efflux protein